MQLRNIIRNLWPVSKADSLKRFDFEGEKDKNIYGVYHVFCVNAWKALVKEQLNAMQEAGLMAKTDKLFISCIYNKVEERRELEQILSSYDVPSEIISALPMDNNLFEFPALEFIHGLAAEEDFYVYYFHTKGVSYTKERAENYPIRKLEKLNACSKAWRKMMEYFIFAKHNVALNVLKQYDTYGCKYDDPIVPPYHYRYYAGNFWWSKASYLRTLPRITDEERKNRYWAENWLCLNAKRIFSPFNTPVELYAVEIPQCVYISTQFGGGISQYIKFVLEHYVFLTKKLLKLT